MPLPDIDASRAVLIGTADYRHLPPLPAVADRLDAFAAWLGDPEVWGLPKEHCTVVLDPASADEMLDAVHRAAREAADALLVLYAGHGLVAPDLLLTLAGSDASRLYRSVRFADLSREIVGSSCRHKAVILDCSGFAAAPAVDGAWVLAGDQGFTGELTKVLDEGVPDGPALLSLDTLFLRASRRFPARQHMPRRGLEFVVARNRAARPGAVPAPAPPADDQPYLRLTPKVMAEKVAAMRAAGHPELAEVVLAGSGRLRSEQEVAAIMATLAAAGQPHEVAAVAFAAAARDPRELRRIYEVLLEIDEPRLATGLLKVIAEGLPERTARFVAALDSPDEAAQRRAGSDVPEVGGSRRVGPDTAEAGPLLLRAAASAGKGRPRRVVDLLAALTVAGRTDDADLLLTEARRVLPADDLAVVADALRDAGRVELAGQLYGQAIAAVARREAADVVAIVGMLPDGAAERLVRAAVAARTADPLGLAALIAADLPLDVVPALGGKLARPVLVELIRVLRERGCEDAALRLYLAAAADRPVDDVLRLGENLTAQGRVMDALDLLGHAARVRTVEDLDRMTGPAWPASPGRNRRIFAAVAEAPARAAALYRILADRDDGRLAQFRTELLQRPDAEIVAVAAALLAAGATAQAADLLRTAVRAVAGMTPQRLAAAAVRAGQLPIVLHLATVVATADLPPILHEVVTAHPDAERRLAPLLGGLPRRAVAGIVLWFRATRGGTLTEQVAALPAADVVTIAAAVTRPDDARPANDLLAVVAGGRLLQVRDVLAELRRRGERAHLRTLVDVFRDRSADDAAIFKLAGWLWALEERELAQLALRERLWAPESVIEDALAAAVADHLHRYALQTGRASDAWPNASDFTPLPAGETPLLTLSFVRRKRLLPVLFTARAVHHAGGGSVPYRALLDVRVTPGKRTAVVVAAPGAEPDHWDMPSAAAAEELIDLLADLAAVVDQFPENVRDTAVIHVEPVPPDAPRRYELEGELS